MYATIRSITPPSDSSPPSSPAPYLDSSPASSPGLDGVNPNLLDIPPLSLPHPFAASVKATKLPPQYEKKRLTPPSTPPRKSPSKKARYFHTPEDLEATPRPTWPLSPSDKYLHFHKTSKTPGEIEASIWDEASSRVVDGGHGAVVLDNENLTCIPETFVADLANFYIPPESSEIANSLPSTAQPLKHITTTASAEEPGPRSFSRTRSNATESFGFPRENLQLLLYSNNITSLPSRLMTLEKLSVLSLRGNFLTRIPPEIAALTNLQSLNIANNKIQYLPAEMLRMSLVNLQVHPNPFLEPPLRVPSGRKLSLRSSTASRSDLWDKERQVSATTHCLPKTISLVELSLRALVLSSTMLKRMLMEQMSQGCYPPLPSHLDIVSKICAPPPDHPSDRASYQDTSGTATPLPAGVGICPSPRHKDIQKRSVFVHHAEERFSWEETIAGVRMGGLVPVQWRGCLWGCLDFLKIGKGGEAESGVDMDSDADNDLPMDEGIVQIIQFDPLKGISELDFDD